MKYITKIVLLIIFVCQISIVIGQENNNTLNIIIKGIYDNSENVVKLKWMPSDHEVLDLGITYGYNVLRVQTTDNNGDQLLIEDQIRTEVVSGLKPLSQSELELLSTGDDHWAAFADSLLYTELITKKENPSLLDAIDGNRGVESKHMFYLLLSEKDFDISKALALGFVDDQVQANVEYMYFISIDLPNDFMMDGSIKRGAVVVQTDSTGSLLPVTEFLGYGTDSMANLSWNVSNTKDFYTYYNIERSIDEVNFTTVNEEPFIFMGQELTDQIFYTNKLEDNNTEYYFRIVGISPFGGFGPPSEVIKVQGIPDPYEFKLSIDSLEAVSEQLIKAHWESFAQSVEAVIDHFDILRLIDIDGKPETLNATPLSPSTRSYDIVDPLGDAYYILQAIDIHGRQYRSIAVLGQAIDTTPPVQPTGLTGNIKSNGDVSLKWAPNPDADLLGYKVLYSNSIEGVYSQLTSSEVYNTEYETSVYADVEVDSIYYKIMAVDVRYNSSELSEPLALARPDNVAPSNPVIAAIMGRPEGLRISWRLSTSDDVVRHILKRKLKEGSTWEDVITIDNDSQYPPLPLVQYEMTPSNYIDTTELQLRMYHYRLIAEDEVGNQSASSIEEVFPYDDGIRGAVINLAAADVSSTVNNGTSEGSGEGSGTLTAAASVLLTWDYTTDFPRSLLEFKIYKIESKFQLSPADLEDPHDPFITVATIDPRQDPLILGNTNTPINSEYYYAEKNVPITQSYQYYKVIAWHRDGGFSLWSEIVEIDLGIN